MCTACGTHPTTESDGQRVAPRGAGPEPQSRAGAGTAPPEAEPSPWTVALQAPLLWPRSHTQRMGGCATAAQVKV